MYINHPPTRGGRPVNRTLSLSQCVSFSLSCVFSPALPCLRPIPSPCLISSPSCVHPSYTHTHTLPLFIFSLFDHTRQGSLLRITKAPLCGSPKAAPLRIGQGPVGLLWIYGKRTSFDPLRPCLSNRSSIAGVGKIVLTYVISQPVFGPHSLSYVPPFSSAVIKKVNAVFNAGSGYMAVFFFDFKDTTKQDARALLSSLVVQLSNQPNSFYHILLGFHSAHQDGTQQPSVASLIRCLEYMLLVPYVIVEALDECPHTTGMPSLHRQVSALVERLVESNAPNLHLCITSRPEIDI